MFDTFMSLITVLMENLNLHWLEFLTDVVELFESADTEAVVADTVAEHITPEKVDAGTEQAHAAVDGVGAAIRDFLDSLSK